MASIPALQLALDRVLERARTKLDIALRRARDEEVHAEASKLRLEEAAEARKLRQSMQAHEEELFLLQKARLVDEPSVPAKAVHAPACCDPADTAPESPVPGRRWA